MLEGMTPGQIADALADVPMHSRPATFTALTGCDPAALPMRCEAPECTAVVPLATAYSPALFLRMAGPDVPHHFCDEGDSGQHFYCSMACAEAGIQHCWHEHIKPKYERLSAAAAAQRADLEATSATSSAPSERGD